MGKVTGNEVGGARLRESAHGHQSDQHMPSMTLTGGHFAIRYGEFSAVETRNVGWSA